MTVSKVTLAVILLLLHMSATHTVKSPKQKNHPTLLSKRRFLSPRDLRGSYSRFLEVSENSTLCPNTVTHNTNGVLYPSGYIHIPLHEVSQDGITCAGSGELVIRFRRRLSSKEIEHEFNITANASGIDKMVRDILLTLDGFYFGRQTKERNCQGSYLPANTAFFFTSQAKPFAANVGVPFRRNPKIMFLVDKTRVCAFSGSFMPGEAIASQPVPQISMAPKPRATSPRKQKMESPSNLMKTKAQKETINNTLEAPTGPQGTLAPSKQYKETPPPPQGNMAQPPGTLAPSVQYKETPASPKGNMAEALGSQAPSVQYNEMPRPPQGSRARKHGTEYMKISSPLPTSGTESDNEGKIHHDGTSPPHGKKKPGKFNKDVMSSSPFPSKLPQQSLEGSLSFPYKQSNESGRPSSRPSRYPTKDPSQTAIVSNMPSRSPTPKSKEAYIPSASPGVLVLPSPSTSPPRPRPLSAIFTADDMSPSPSPNQNINREGYQSYLPSQGELQGSNPVISATILPEPSASDVIIGDSSSTCFPSSATVTLSNGGIKRMDELSIGTSIFVGSRKRSRIIDFSHFDRTIVSEFLHLQTESGRNLTVTGSHFVYTDHGLVPAVKVTLGDYLKLSDGRPTRVVSVSKVWARGLFNPHTETGNIVVDGFVVSTYTLAAAPMTAHALLAPVRFLYDVGFRAAIVSKLASQPAIARAFRSLLSDSMHSTTF